eukprot:TRINITY_DN2046_c0_g1_i1.p1 TRINITY_DN2046_c0_g1~~TRINITY_DN2046_c0_g1_i1.p1  ORF type:complete len:287 (-),score=35.19 TRINITY_DN2046_c0_g1_i1:155-1015(-)
MECRIEEEPRGEDASGAGGLRSPSYMKLMRYITHIYKSYASRGMRVEQVISSVFTKLFNKKPSINWRSLRTTSEYHKLRAAFDLDDLSTQFVLLLQEEITNLRPHYIKAVAKRGEGPRNEEFYEYLFELFQYRIERNLAFEKAIAPCVSSSGSDNGVSESNSDGDVNLLHNPLIAFEDAHQPQFIFGGSEVEGKGGGGVPFPGTLLKKKKRRKTCKMSPDASDLAVPRKRRPEESFAVAPQFDFGGWTSPLRLSSLEGRAFLEESLRRRRPEMPDSIERELKRVKG